MDSTTTVRNVTDCTYDPANPDHVYIGRSNLLAGLPGSKWANPYPLRYERDRAAVLERYRAYLRDNARLLAALPELKGKTLYCWCAPKACHGHLLAALVNGDDPDLLGGSD